MTHVNRPNQHPTLSSSTLKVQWSAVEKVRRAIARHKAALMLGGK